MFFTGCSRSKSQVHTSVEKLHQICSNFLSVYQMAIHGIGEAIKRLLVRMVSSLLELNQLQWTWHNGYCYYFLPSIFCFFLKAPRSTGESCKILDAHADRTQHKRGCPSSLGTRHTEVLTPPRTHAHTPWRTPQHPREHCSQCEPSVELRSNAGGRRPSGQPYQRA